MSGFGKADIELTSSQPQRVTRHPLRVCQSNFALNRMLSHLVQNIGEIRLQLRRSPISSSRSPNEPETN